MLPSAHRVPSGPAMQSHENILIFGQRGLEKLVQPAASTIVAMHLI